MTDEQEVQVIDEDDVDETEEFEIEVITPIIVDLGKAKAKQVKRLKQGRGRLMGEVVDVLDEVTEALGEELDGKTLVPVIMLYEKKRKRKQRRITVPLPF
jgi:hypothetical protein